jgi:hypothetical protein
MDTSKMVRELSKNNVDVELKKTLKLIRRTRNKYSHQKNTMTFEERDHLLSNFVRARDELTPSTKVIHTVKHVSCAKNFPVYNGTFVRYTWAVVGSTTPQGGPTSQRGPTPQWDPTLWGPTYTHPFHPTPHIHPTHLIHPIHPNHLIHPTHPTHPIHPLTPFTPFTPLTPPIPGESTGECTGERTGECTGEGSGESSGEWGIHLLGFDAAPFCYFFNLW